MNVVGSEEEAPSRALTGEPPSWQRVRRLRLFGSRYDSLFVAYNVLHGVAWNCPKCGEHGMVSLRERRPQRFWFECSHCGWKQAFNYVRANQLLTSIGASTPR